MKKRPVTVLAVATLTAAAITFSVWPAFPDPHGLAGRDFKHLKMVLGPPTDGIPTKFVAWTKRRGIVTWTFEAGIEQVPVPNDAVMADLRRCLWFEWAGITILCNSASASPNPRHRS